MMMSEMPHEELRTTNRKIQMAVSCWAVAAFVWYFHQFSPVVSPILHGLLAQDMALAQAVSDVFRTPVFCLAFASLGNRILRSLRWEMESAGEHFLVATAIGVVTTEILLFLVQLTQHIKQGCWAIAAYFAFCSIVDWKTAWRTAEVLPRQTVPASKGGRFLFVLVSIVLCVGFLVFLSSPDRIGRIALSLHGAEGNPGTRLSSDLFEFAQLPVRTASPAHSFWAGPGQ